MVPYAPYVVPDSIVVQALDIPLFLLDGMQIWCYYSSKSSFARQNLITYLPKFTKFSLYNDEVST